MEKSKLLEIIAHKNDNLERMAVHTAQQIIEDIAELQQAKIQADEQLQTLRAKLKALQIVQIDPTSILGE